MLYKDSSHIAGTGVFVNRDIQKGEIVFKLFPSIVSSQMLHLFKDSDRAIQVDQNKFAIPSFDFDGYINHCCSPNVGLRIESLECIYFFALRKLYSDEEILWDYSTTATGRGWKMPCSCADAFPYRTSPKCRGTISGIETVPWRRVLALLWQGAIPNYALQHRLNCIFKDLLV